MPGTIIVKPIQAKLDKEERALTKLDPYCVAIIGDRHVESEVCKKGGSLPAWHDALALTRKDEPYCYLEVKDKSLLKDKMLGICAIDLDELTQQGNVQKWYELYCNKQHTGEILIEASIADDDDYKGGIEGARAMSPERFSSKSRENRIFQTYTEGSTAHYSSANRESYRRHEQPLGGHSPFNNMIFETPASGYEPTPSSMTYVEKDRFYDSPIEPPSKIYESQSTVRDIMGALGTRELSGISNQTGIEANYGYDTFVTRPTENEVDRNIADLQRKVDDVLRKSKIMEEERKLRESHLFFTSVQTQPLPELAIQETQILQGYTALPPVQTQPLPEFTMLETQPIQDFTVRETQVLQDFTRQDSAVSIPSENPGNEGLPMFIDTHSELVHASHNKFLGDDSNAISRAGEFRMKLQERVEKGKNMIRERIRAMADQEDDHSQPSLKHKLLVGVEKALEKRQGASFSERKAPRERIYEVERTEQSSGKGSNIKEKIFGGVEQIAHSSIKTLSKLERKMREKRGIEEELIEEREEQARHSKSAKKESLKEKVEYIKDVSREKVLARLRKPAVDEGVQTEGMYVNEGEKPGKIEVIKEKVEQIKDAAKEKVEEITQKKKKKGHKKRSSSESSEEEVVVEDDRTLGEKVKDGVAKGAKKVALKIAKKKVEQAQENVETNQPKKKKTKVIRKVREESPCSSELSEEEEEHIPREERVPHQKHHRHHHKYIVEEEEQKGVVDKVKEKIEHGAKRVAIKVAKNQVLKAEEELEEPTDIKKKKSHKKIQKKHIKERSVSPTYSDEVQHTQPGKIEGIKEAIMEGVEKVKGAIQERQVQTEEKQPKKRSMQEKSSEEGTLKQKLMQEMEQIRDFAQQKIAQFGSKETEEHETAQRIYDEYERSAEKTYEYEQMNIEQPLSVNTELVDGMKDLTATLDRLQQKIEARIASQQEYNRSIGATYVYDSASYQSTNSGDVSGTIATIKEKVKEGIEKITKPKEEENITQPHSIAGLMDQLSEQIQDMKIDDKIYLTKEYKQSIAEEEHHKVEHREGRMRTLKLKVKEGVDHVKNMAHAHTMTHQESITVFDTEQPQNPGIVDTALQLIKEDVGQTNTMTQSQKEKEVDEMFDLYGNDKMIQLQEDVPMKPGVAQTIKQKVMEGVEQVKHMAHVSHESHHQAEVPSGPIADLMDHLSEEINKPKETVSIAQDENKGVIEKVKEGVKDLVIRNNEGKLYSGMGGKFLTGGAKEPQEVTEEVLESPSSTIFKYDYTKDEHPLKSEVEHKHPTGVVETIKQKVKEGIDKVKGMVQNHEIHEEENELSTDEVFRPHKELPRTPEASPKGEQAVTSVYFKENKAEEEMTSSEVFHPHHELKRSPTEVENLVEEHERLAESVYVGEDTIGSIVLETGRPFEYGLDIKQSDLFSFGAPSGKKYPFEENREFESKPVQNAMCESQYVKQSDVGFGTQTTDFKFTLEENKPIENAIYESSRFAQQSDLGFDTYGEFNKDILQENKDFENKSIENVIYESQYVKQRDMIQGNREFESKPVENVIYESQYVPQDEFAKGILQENKDFVNKPVEDVMYESQYTKQMNMGFGGQGDLGQEKTLFEQQVKENKENIEQKGSFDKVFEDFTNSSTQFNW